MYELVQVSDSCYYIDSPVKAGLVKTGDNTVCLIDSGNDSSAGKKIKRIIESNGWTLQAIYNTHSHADHIGGNQYLQTQTGCSIYAAGIERDFTVHPILESSYLYGGNPPSELRHKFLFAKESNAKLLTEDTVPSGWDIIPLPGHSFDMVGFRTPDNIVYLADCLSSRETLEKYQISFLTDVEQYLNTLEIVKTIEGNLFIPAHTEPTDNITQLAQYNIDKVNEIADMIADICSTPLMSEQVLKQLFDRYELTMTPEQYVLVGSTVRCYLTWMKESGRLTQEIDRNMLLWRTTA